MESRGVRKTKHQSSLTVSIISASEELYFIFARDINFFETSRHKPHQHLRYTVPITLWLGPKARFLVRGTRAVPSISRPWWQCYPVSTVRMHTDLAGPLQMQMLVTCHGVRKLRCFNAIRMHTFGSRQIARIANASKDLDGIDTCTIRST